MIKTAATFTSLLLIFATGYINAEPVAINGYARNYSGILFHSNNYGIVQNTFDLTFTQKTESAGLKANPYVRKNEIDETSQLDIREVYLDMFFDFMDIRAGKQQIIWGKADGVFITDVVSPRDLSEFILPDFTEIRMGITALKIDLYIGEQTIEVAAVPIFTPVKMPDTDSIWYPKFNFLPEIPGNPSFDYSKKDVEKKLKNGEIFAKYSILSSIADIEIMGGYMWDDEPSLHVEKNIDPITHQLLSVTVSPQHHRLTLAGGSFSATIDPFVIRGEAAYYQGKYFNSTDASLEDGLVKKNYLHYLAGADFTLWDIKISGQFIQKIIFGYNDYIVNPEYSGMATILLKRDFINETLHLEFFAYYDFDQDDALVRPTVSYDLTDGFEIILGANIFIGDRGIFGQYSDNSMIYSKVKYSF